MKHIQIKPSIFTGVMVFIINLLFIILGLFCQCYKLMLYGVIINSIFYIILNRNRYNKISFTKDDNLILKKQKLDVDVKFLYYFEITFLLSVIIAKSGSKIIFVPLFIDSVELDDYKYIRWRYRHDVV